jgi:uncharacterized phiE125 gp8 family phage protein
MNFVRNTFPDALNRVTLATAKTHLRVEHTTDDALITTLISVAQDLVEAYTGAKLQPTTGHFYFDSFREFINLHAGPDLTINTAIDGVTYINNDGVRTTVAASNYQLDGKGYPARLRMMSIPTDIKDEINVVRIDVSMGYTGDTLPDALIAAMLLIIGHLYENRQDVGQFKTFETPLASRYLMEPYRLKSFT